VADLDVLSPEEAVAAIGAPGVTTEKVSALVTAASLRLDEAVGPIVRRTITAERCRGAARTIELRRWPVVSISSLVEYDEAGAATTLTAGTPSSRPADGYWLTPTDAEPELGLYRPIVERRGGSRTEAFAETVVATYVAGRFANTAAVTERYKEAARLVVLNLWQRIGNGTTTFEDVELPRYPFPRFALPRAVYELLPDVWQEFPDGRPIGIA